MKNTGQIIRSDKSGKSNYTPITNDILQSKTLTCEQKSILVHLLSMPKDWVIYKNNFWKNMNIGRERFNKAWKVLEELGYIVMTKNIGKNNLIVGYSYIVYEVPLISGRPEIGDTNFKNVTDDKISNVISERPEIGNTDFVDNINIVSVQPEIGETEILLSQNLVSKQSNNIKSNKIQSNILESIIENIDINKRNIKENNNREIIAKIINAGEKFDISKYENYFDKMCSIKEQNHQNNSSLDSKETYSKLIPSMYPEVEVQLNLLGYILQTNNYNKDLISVLWYYSQNYQYELRKLFDYFLPKMHKLLKKDLTISKNAQFAEECSIRGINPKEYLNYFE